MANIEAHYLHGADFRPVAEETIALYVDGNLMAIGPQPEVLDKAMKMLGIKQVFSPDFMRGQDTYALAAKTLDEINAYKAEANAAEAEALRQQAADLLRKANELEGRTDPAQGTTTTPVQPATDQTAEEGEDVPTE